MTITRSKTSASAENRKERREAKAANKSRMEKAKAERYEAKTKIREKNGGARFTVTFGRVGKKCGKR